MVFRIYSSCDDGYCAMTLTPLKLVVQLEARHTRRVRPVSALEAATRVQTQLLATRITVVRLLQAFVNVWMSTDG